MKLLVSFCNQKDVENNITNNNLAFMDIEKNSVEELTLDFDNAGVVGINQDNKFIYILYQHSDYQGIALLDKTNFKTILNQQLLDLKDAHSIVVDGRNIYAVSSGSDQVLEYKYDDVKNEIQFVREVWRPELSEAKSDTHHLNSLFLYENNLYVSGFGLRQSDRWSSAKEGYVYNITQNKLEVSSIYHPHSVFVKSSREIYYCESSTRSVKRNMETILRFDTGYVRGLYFDKKYMAVGISSGRKKSKSTGEINNIADPGMLEEECKVVVFKKKLFGKDNYKKIAEYNFLPQHREIYDVLILQ